MNERIRELYDQAIILEGNGDYVAGELDPVKFAELIVQECIDTVANCKGTTKFDHWSAIKEHFGVEE
jgi:hypothetical protein